MSGELQVIAPADAREEPWLTNGAPDAAPSVEAANESSPIQLAWLEHLDEVRRTSAPHRWTYPGQDLPWVDPIPLPDDDSPYIGPRGLSPRAMLRRVRRAFHRGDLDNALRWLDDMAWKVSTLGSPAWDKCIAEERSRMAGSGHACLQMPGLLPPV